MLPKIWNNLKYGKPSSFKNEISVLKEFEKIEFKHFRYPRILKTDNRNFVAIEYLEGKNGWAKDDITNKMMVSSLLEFQFSGIKLKKSLVTVWNRTIPIKVIKWSRILLKTGFDIVNFSKCILLALGGFFTQYEECIITHNDLFRYNNLITGNDGNIYFYDFEFTTNTNKFFLIDIIDLCFDLEFFNINNELLTEYILQLLEYIPIHKIIRYFEEQSRLIMLRKLLGVLVSTSVNTEKKEYSRKFIKNTILSKERYKEWFNQNIAIVYKSFLIEEQKNEN